MSKAMQISKANGKVLDVVIDTYPVAKKQFNETTTTIEDITNDKGDILVRDKCGRVTIYYRDSEDKCLMINLHADHILQMAAEIKRLEKDKAGYFTPFCEVYG